MYIYQITNKINGKSYVGKTSRESIYDRWKTHLYDSRRKKTKLYNAINKYGSDLFDISVIEFTGQCSRERLNDRECYWIDVLCPEYNMTSGGDGGLIHDQTGNTWKIKDTSNMKGKKTITPLVLEGRQKTTGSNNYQSLYLIHTPWGIFHTWKDAIVQAKKLKVEGERSILTDTQTLRRYCLNNFLLNAEGRRTPPDWRGCYTRDLGFYIKEKQNEQN